jgi:alcohol dehydrogenase class IV
MSDLLPIRKFVAPEIIFGSGSRHLIAQHVLSLHGRSVLLVSDPGVIRAGWTGEIADLLSSKGLDVTLFHELTPNPKTAEIMKGAEVYRRNGCDVIISVGGGSAIDCGKALGVAVTNHCHILEMEGVDLVKLPGPPMICIPTTAGSSADVSQFAAFSDETRRRKTGIVSKTMVPDLTIIDPETTVTMPPRLTAATGLDALCHGIEAYVSNASSTITDLNALEAIRLLTDNLLRAYDSPEDLKAREPVMLASMYAGLAMSNASLGLVHSMAHSLGGYLDYPHGECNAKLLKHVIPYNYPFASERYRRIEQIMRGSKPGGSGGPDGLVEVLEEMIQHMGMDQGLSGLGMKEEDIPYLTDIALQDACHYTNPRPVVRSDIEELFFRAL